MEDHEIYEEYLRKMLIFLTPKEEQIMRMLFGIDEERCYQPNETAERFAVTTERINQLFYKAMTKLFFIAARSHRGDLHSGKMALTALLNKVAENEEIYPKLSPRRY